MSLPTRGLAGALAGMAVLAVMSGSAGCSVAPEPAVPSAEAPAPSERSALPPRPREIRMEGLDPCALVPPDVLRQAGVSSRPKVEPNRAPGVRQCSWSNFPATPSATLAVTTATAQPVTNVLSEADARVTSVAGFGAVEITDDWAGAENSCDLRVDVAPNQGLWVQFYNTLADEPGRTHELMCQRARTAAEGVLRHLLATTG